MQKAREDEANKPLLDKVERCIRMAQSAQLPTAVALLQSAKLELLMHANGISHDSIEIALINELLQK